MPSSKLSPRLLVLGDIILDRYVFGTTTRINPEAPVPVVDVIGEEFRLGGAANVVNNLLSLGASVTLLSVTGDDDAGMRLRRELHDAGIECDAVAACENRMTTVKDRIIVESQQVTRVDWETRTPISPDVERRLAEHASRLVPNVDVVIISDYAKGVVTNFLAQHVICICRALGIPVLVDPKDEIQKYQGATVFKPNLKEAVRMSGKDISSDKELEDASRHLRRSLDVEHVMITLGEQGYMLVGDELHQSLSTATEVVDVTGAGDTTLAVLGWALASGASMEDAAELANRAGGISVGKFGTSCVTADELKDAEPAVGVDSNIRTVDELSKITQALQAEGRTVVLTNGCFDLLHVGHITYLKESRRCGEALIVGINSDDSVKRLKGDGRPMFDEGERSRIVAALTPVDYVFVFDEDTPYEAIGKIKPDILTKGDDYTYEQVVGNDLVDDVRLIPMVRGKSSTTAIGRIQRAA